MAGEVMRLAPWLHAEDIVEAAGWLAAEPLTLRGAPLRRLLRELESTDQHFLTDAMASEAWILQTRDKLAPGVAETAVAEQLWSPRHSLTLSGSWSPPEFQGSSPLQWRLARHLAQSSNALVLSSWST
ncbi:unnamed protein product [Polarella glacialis]|uniref:Uncharacterized protein n=1 Tax=Polarella glacialis TaxID=89957 RepID=A0A813FIC6_POLGL|nr:unnamed protein product [Polarella glacialis]